MAQRARTTATTKTSSTGRRPGRPLGSTSKSKPGPTPAARKVGRPTVAKPVAASRKPPTASATLKAGTTPAKRGPGRPTESKPKAVPTPAAGKWRQAVAAKPAGAGRKAPAAAAAPKVGKGALQAQVEKLERTVATLRTRSRAAVRAAKEAAARIEELEGQLAERAQAPKLSAATSRTAKPTRRPAAAAAPELARPAKSARGRRLNPERDPGDAVPPGVAVQESEPMDEEATAAFDSLEATLHPVEE